MVYPKNRIIILNVSIRRPVKIDLSQNALDPHRIGRSAWERYQAADSSKPVVPEPRLPFSCPIGMFPSLRITGYVFAVLAALLLLLLVLIATFDWNRACSCSIRRTPP